MLDQFIDGLRHFFEELTSQPLTVVDKIVILGTIFGLIAAIAGIFAAFYARRTLKEAREQSQLQKHQRLFANCPQIRVEAGGDGRFRWINSGGPAPRWVAVVQQSSNQVFVISQSVPAHFSSSTYMLNPVAATTQRVIEPDHYFIAMSLAEDADGHWWVMRDPWRPFKVDDPTRQWASDYLRREGITDLELDIEWLR